MKSVSNVSPASQAAPPLAPPPTCRELFLGFLSLGLISFGGALPHARRIVVEERRWIDSDDFIELLGLCQFLPGGNVINFSVALGMRFHGVAGAMAALLGLIAGPSAIVVMLGVIYDRTQDYPAVRHLFTGLAAAAAGLLVTMAWKVVAPLMRRLSAACIVVLGFVAIALLRLPLIPTMLTLMPISIGLAWFESRRRARAASETEAQAERKTP